jgi:hypothetical protein
MAFKLKSGNTTNFKNMGSSPAKDMKTGSYKHKFESPAKQRLKKGGEGQDEDKIFNNEGKHVGNWVNDKKVMFTKKELALMPEGDQGDFEPAYPGADVDRKEYEKQLKKEKINKGRPAKKGESPAKKTKTTKAEKRKNLLKAVPNEEAFNKLSKVDQEGFTKKAKEVGLPMMPKKKSPAKQAKRKGFGPSKAFGGVLNPELVNWEKRFGKKETSSRKVMKDGSSNRAHYKGKVVEGWTNPYAVKPKRK